MDNFENVVSKIHKTKATATISDDAMNVNATVSFERDGQTVEIKRKETRKLSDRGQGF